MSLPFTTARSKPAAIGASTHCAAPQQQQQDDNRAYFAGTINHPFRNAQGSGDFARSLAARFDAAISGLDNFIIVWWDGSSDSRDGGSAPIVDVCLPAWPKFTLQFAKPTTSFGNNSVLMELYGALHACILIKRILTYCQTENLLRDVVGKLEIVLVTDCMSVLHHLGSFGTDGGMGGRIAPILTKIKRLYEDIVGFKRDSISLDLNHCHRNQTANLVRADQLAGRARGQGMAFQSAVHHEDVGDRKSEDVIYYNSWERPNNTPDGQMLETQLQDALRQHPFSLKRKRDRFPDDTREISKRHKISESMGIRRSLRMMARLPST